MDKINILIIFSSFVFLVLLWVTVGIRHLKNLKKTTQEQWELLDESLRKRHDLLPNLVETVRWYKEDSEEILEKLIKDRQSAAKQYLTGAQKIEYEHELTHSINFIFALGKDNKELATDTNFLELKKEIDDLENVIEDKSKRYNEMIRYYNKHNKSILLKPIAYVFGFKDLNIFEMEK